jgi:hypothetical protein
MKKLLLTGIAALFLATGTARSHWYSRSDSRGRPTGVGCELFLGGAALWVN